jgi:hypothetical protein
MLALHWLARGYGYEVSATDVWAAYSHAMRAAERIGRGHAVRGRIRRLVAGEAADAVGSQLVAEVLGREIGVV